MLNSYINIFPKYNNFCYLNVYYYKIYLPYTLTKPKNYVSPLYIIKVCLALLSTEREKERAVVY